jgi:cobalt-precorrin 5A hydrolase
MVGGKAMIVAGIGCRRLCPADEIVALVRHAGNLATPAETLAAPAFKRDEAGLLEAARLLGLPLVFIEAAALQAAQQHCVTQSSAAERATGMASVAEAAALAQGGALLLPRIASARATCAIAERP